MCKSSMQSVAFGKTDILLPKEGTDMGRWAVIACDQYTSEPDYWKEVSEKTDGFKSTLNMILPEVYLEEENVSERIGNIHSSMNSYLESDTFELLKDSMVYVRRIQGNGILREGIVGAIDLEQYDYTKGSTSQVRATEATVIERIPPRVKVRRNAPLELPHIMILIDDEDKSVIEPFAEKMSGLRKLYDTELMQNGGSISGYLLEGDECCNVDAALKNLAEKNAEKLPCGTPLLLFAMGDGNHSLATAKEYYEELKRQNPDKDMSSHPARYALAEIVNLHSPALQFEAIHRIVTGVNTEKLVSAMAEELKLSDGTEGQSFEYVTGGVTKTVSVGAPSSNLTVGSLQAFLDGYIKENGGKIDYIHGKDVLMNLAQAEGSIGFILPDMDKADLFPTVIKDGALPRKTFSMGHAEDKRFYIECRMISE